MKNFLKTMAAVLLCCVTSGCASLNLGQRGQKGEDIFMDPQEILTVNPDLRFDDLPIPVGFLIDIQSSYAFQNNEIRVALLRYVGKESVRTLIEFFKEQMPRYNWELLSQVEFEQTVLNFEKRGEICIVMIEPQRKRVLVTLSISPR